MNQQKVCFIGGSSVGKTSLIRRCVEGIFSEKYLTTIGVKIDKKHIVTNQGETLLLIWDIEGTDAYCGFQARYLKGAGAYVLVIDQSRPNAFKDAVDIYHLAKQATNAPAFLMINKSDLTNHLSPQQSDLLSTMEFAATFSTSAKSGDCVNKAFASIAVHLLHGHHEHG